MPCMTRPGAGRSTSAARCPFAGGRRRSCRPPSGRGLGCYLVQALGVLEVAALGVTQHCTRYRCADGQDADVALPGLGEQRDLEVLLVPADGEEGHLLALVAALLL